MEKVQVTGVSETMLQTLYARAAYSKTSNAKFHDSMAEEIVSRMDYDFSLAGKDAMMSKGVIARTILLDRMAGNFIEHNPNGTVVNIACGLDTRGYRLNTPRTVRWYNLDLPETIEVRRRSLRKTGIFPRSRSRLWTKAGLTILRSRKAERSLLLRGL